MVCETLIIYEAPLEHVAVDCGTQISFTAPQGPAGPPGTAGPPGLLGPPGGAAGQRVAAIAVGGVETVSLLVAPSSFNAVQLFVNGLLHSDTADYTISGTTLSLQTSAETVAGDSITVIFY